MIQDQVRQLGIEVTIRGGEYAALEPDMLSGNFDAALLRTVAPVSTWRVSCSAKDGKLLGQGTLGRDVDLETARRRRARRPRTRSLSPRMRWAVWTGPVRIVQMLVSIAYQPSTAASAFRTSWSTCQARAGASCSSVVMVQRRQAVTRRLAAVTPAGAVTLSRVLSCRPPADRRACPSPPWPGPDASRGSEPARRDGGGVDQDPAHPVHGISRAGPGQGVDVLQYPVDLRAALDHFTEAA
ncbi:hypothetical protein [Streptomyces sp. NBC_01803]|uniref:hypothetical protein n=1 Tax=Streptomyces sp. NBC_01803 TaxID=2975946 RepID=UPI002DD8DEAF|nr:hypothetical protein [Streptomyces sp. NBC_01803]WSA44538.1 hypothetical protein OIE51_10165 [Streptomyces sp. NBC_01803]